MPRASNTSYMVCAAGKYRRNTVMSQPSVPKTDVLTRSRPYMTCSAIHSTMLSRMPMLRRGPLAAGEERRHITHMVLRFKGKTLPIYCQIILLYNLAAGQCKPTLSCRLVLAVIFHFLPHTGLQRGPATPPDSKCCWETVQDYHFPMRQCMLALLHLGWANYQKFQTCYTR